MAFNLGGVVRLTYAVRNAAGTLTDPSAATVTITQPDGTTTSPTVTLPPTQTGQLVVDFTPTQAGLHSVHWTTTTPTTGEDDVFTVEAPARMLVSVDEAIKHLRASGVITSDDDREQLQTLCLAATDAVERDLGRVIVRRTITETHDGGRSHLSLRQAPVVSITSVVAGGVTLDPTGYQVDALTGLLWSGGTSYRSSFAYGYGNVVVTYVAGYASPPAVVRMVALNVVQASWQMSQQAPHPFVDESAEFQVATAVAGLPDPLRNAYDSLRAVAIA